MIFLRKILFPFAVLYGWITQFRNFLFDKAILKSYTFDIPIIAVGNLSTGGTGKTPQIEYLIRLLSNKYKIATLSRGYKRKSEGFILADATATALTLGDEPLQFYQKFPHIKVAVDADRKNGIEQLLLQKDKPEIILLDDAFQHRKVKADFYILLSSYDDLFYNDYILPTGNLRESRTGAKRADVIIITKCPRNISVFDQQKIRIKINLDRPIFFSFIDYDDNIYSSISSLIVKKIQFSDKLLVAGIAKPEPFFAHFHGKNDITMTFPDHHHFSEKEISEISEKAENRIIITTEKDYMRLKNRFPAEQLYYLPIKTSFVSGQQSFDKTILNFVPNVNAIRRVKIKNV